MAQRGYSRDGKKGIRQSNFGLLRSSEGCPVALEVFADNTGDPATVQAQVDKLRDRFAMERILLLEFKPQIVPCSQSITDRSFKKK